MVQNFFELLNQPQQYLLDPADLEHSWLEAQKKTHPDGHNALIDSVRSSALLNQAYLVLKDPFQRAVYLLSLYGIELKDIKPSTDFLMQQMDWQEQRDIYQSEITRAITKHWIDISACLTQNNDNSRQIAALKLVELKFLEKLC